MSIRIRVVEGITVALCAAETDPKPGDVYLDDAHHHALAAKFAQDWQGRTINWEYPEEWAAMESQKLRDAEEEIIRALAAHCPNCNGTRLVTWRHDDGDTLTGSCPECAGEKR